MIFRKILFLWLLKSCALSLAMGQDVQNTIQAYIDGNVWTGQNFEKNDLFIQNGKFISAARSDADTVISLDNRYTIPAFADAHNHNFGVGGYSIMIARELYLANGIFYAMDLTNPYSKIKKVKDNFSKATTVDVVFANGGITSTGSHPTAAMERINTDKEEITLENLELEGDAYWFLDSLEDVKKKWPKILAQNPGVIKIYFSYVQKGLDKGACYGLCPEVAKAVVRKAHAEGLRVFAHINTENDVAFALDAGVDGLAHIPSGNDGITAEQSNFWMSDETIEKIGAKGLVVTPTASLLIEDADPEKLENEIVKQKDQIRSLFNYGAVIALGADEWRKTSIDEVMYFYENKYFDNKTLLNLITETTSKAIFPNRKIGKLVPGYEATFLALDENPIENFEAIKQISLGVKEGKQVIFTNKSKQKNE